MSCCLGPLSSRFAWDVATPSNLLDQKLLKNQSPRQLKSSQSTSFKLLSFNQTNSMQVKCVSVNLKPNLDDSTKSDYVYTFQSGNPTKGSSAVKQPYFQQNTIIRLVVPAGDPTTFNIGELYEFANPTKEPVAVVQNVVQPTALPASTSEGSNPANLTNSTSADSISGGKSS